MTKSELVELVRKIMNAEGTELELNQMIEKLEKNVPHPDVSDLIFYPDDENEVTPEKIVEKALSYSPIQL